MSNGEDSDRGESEHHIITLEEYLGDMPDRYPEDFNEQIIENGAELLERVNRLLDRVPDLYYVFHGINSGWRPASYNSRVLNASRASRHITAQAIDLTDKNNHLDDLLFTHRELLEYADLYAEWPDNTQGWCHLQSVAPKSGNRYFHP